MVGEIRKYISFISVQSSPDYKEKIWNMICEIEDDVTRASLILEYNNKIHEIDLINKYRKPEQTNHNDYDSIREQLRELEDELNDTILKNRYTEPVGVGNKFISDIDDNTMSNVEVSKHSIVRMSDESMKLQRVKIGLNYHMYNDVMTSFTR